MGGPILTEHWHYSTRVGSEEKTSRQNDQLFERLATFSDDAAFHDALKVMRKAPPEYYNAFTTICETFYHLRSEPKAVKQAQVKMFLLITGKIYQAHQQILDQLNTQRSRVMRTHDPQDCDVILLLCPVLSRVRADVESAFRKIPDGAQAKKVVLVVMHHTRKPDHVVKESKWKDEYPSIIQEVQVLFHETHNGLLQCQRNQQALENLCEELQRMRNNDDGEGESLMPREPYVFLQCDFK
ncbi:hypothetical protein WMY93_007400 [Mugilogobius chulae]|uniref:Uncharacterized protein n=1 Tax=Mugilogobius chulae TaxID=88201 RepID=A0AAW0PGJ8_9GOBI